MHRPVPLPMALFVCLLLVATAAIMAASSVALSGDGAFYLVRILGTEDVYGPSARMLGNAVRQAPVLIGVRAGLTDTYLLAVLLGVGQLVFPAASWCLAIVLARAQLVAFTAVAMLAGLCAGTTWLFNTSESVIAAPLTVLAAVLLWQPRPWRRGDAVLAVVSASVLVATYESAAVTGLILGVWAAWRAATPGSGADRAGGVVFAVMSFLSTVVAIDGVAGRQESTSAQSSLYFVLSGEPQGFYLGLAAIVAILAVLILDRPAWLRWPLLALGGVAMTLAFSSVPASPVAAFQARGGALLAVLVLLLALWGLWIQDRRRPHVCADTEVPGTPGLLLLLPAVFVGAMAVVSFQGVEAWHRSLGAFRAEVDSTHGIAWVDDVLPSDERAVVWGWTSSSLSVIVRRDTASGVLVDRTPSFVPFQPSNAHAQLTAEYTWDD